MYHNNEISIINLSRLQCIVSASANNFSTNTGIGNIGKKWYRSISSLYRQSTSADYITITYHSPNRWGESYKTAVTL